MTLYDDAYTEYVNRNGSLSYTYNSITYNPYDFTSNVFQTLFLSCLTENAAGIRSIFLPNTTQTSSMTNSAIISMVRGAYAIVQENWDAYLSILNQITAGTITMAAQISPAWTAYLSTYTTNRIIEPSNESLLSSISSIPAQVQSNWTQASSGAVDFIKNKPSIPAAQIQSDWAQSSSGSLDFIKNKPATRFQSSASRSLNSAFQLSSTRDCLVNYSVDVSCTLSLTTGQSGTVFLEIASDSGFTTNVQELCRFVNSNSGTLTIGLNLIQAVTGTLSGYVPPAYYCRLRTANNTGSPTFNFRSGQEILL